MAASGTHPVDTSAAMIQTPVALADWLVIAPTVITVMGAAICLMTRKNTSLQPRLGILFLIALVAADIGLLARVAEHGPLTMTMGRWLPPFGIAFTVDMTGAVLATVAGIVALVCGVYAIDDIDRSSRRYGFYPFLLLLMAGVTGSFLTGDIFNLYVWFEVMVISSFGLLILGSEREQLDGAIKYTFLNLLATNLFLIATGYLYGVSGTLNMADIARTVKGLESTAPIVTIASLYFMAFAMKAAAFPVNFWLPAAYHTPRVVVSALFAGLLTKVGIYALARTMLMLFPDSLALMRDLAVWVAVLTLLTGSLGALAQSDVRRLFGYLVIAGIGSMIAGIAIGTPEAVSAMIFYAIHSILVMTALYLILGIMTRLCRSHELNGLGGLYRASPLLAGLFLVLALAVSGLPPFSGFWPKVILVTAALRQEFNWLAGFLLLSGLLTTLAMGRVWIMAFWRGGPLGTIDGDNRALPALEPAQRPSARDLGPVTVLVMLVIVFGVLPDPVIRIASAGAQGLIDPSSYIQSVFGSPR